jgi:hypothetical protein
MALPEALPVLPSIRCASLLLLLPPCIFSFRSLISNGSSACFFVVGTGNPKIRKSLTPMTSNTLTKKTSSVLSESYAMQSAFGYKLQRRQWKVVFALLLGLLSLNGPLTTLFQIYRLHIVE